MQKSRTKISTTIAPETYEFLQELIREGSAANLAEALDSTIQRIRQYEQRKRLAAATAKYFEQMTPSAQQEEELLSQELGRMASELDLDNEL